MIGCSQPAVSAWERGICVPYGQTLEKITELYDLPNDFFNTSLNQQLIQIKKVENKQNIGFKLGEKGFCGKIVRGKEIKY